jgi:hypothetical protein
MRPSRTSRFAAYAVPRLCRQSAVRHFNTFGIVFLQSFAVFVFAFALSWTQDLAAAAPSAAGNDPQLAQPGSIAAASVSTLIILFVIAVLIESALAVIFNWRLFLEMFNGRGVKTVVAVIVSWIVVYTFSLDRKVFEALLAAYGVDITSQQDRTIGILLTTLILAGGSGGVNKILVSLGYRDPASAKPKVPEPPKNKAWVSIRVTRNEAVGPIEVHLEDVGEPTDRSIAELAGVIAPIGFLYRLWSVFFVDRSRYPPTGGHDVVPSHLYRIEIKAKNRDGELIPCELNEQPYRFAEGAIIDFHVNL